jgi:3,4-dihydroxy 2-butanone 4-phosphate synthase / GTP cyclohydrolase II
MNAADFPAPWAYAARRALDDLLAGRMVVVKRDALEQETLAAFVVAGASITPDHLHLMGRLGGDIVWVALGRQRADFLNLVEIRSDRPGKQPATLTPIDLRQTTGLTLADRAATIRALASADKGPADFMRPGHIFPVVVDERQVLLGRPNIPEAAVELLRLSGQQAVVAGSMLMSQGGQPSEVDDIDRVAAAEGFTVVRTSDVALYAMAMNTLLEPGAVTSIPVAGHVFRVQGFRSIVDAHTCVALIRGEVSGRNSVPVYLHRYSTVGDVFQSNECDCFNSLRRALSELEAMPAGVLIYLVSYSPESLGISHGKGCQHRWSPYETAIAAHVLRNLGPRSVVLATPELADTATLIAIAGGTTIKAAPLAGPAPRKAEDTISPD